MQITCLAGFLGGLIGSALTNSLEAITVMKQTNLDTKIIELVRREGSSLLTKGLYARVFYNGAQSIVFFALVNAIGKAYQVELNDD